MSQWVSLRSEVLKKAQKSTLELACQELHVGIDYNVKTIQNPWGAEKVDCGLTDTLNDRKLTLGFTLDDNHDGTYDVAIKGDFWGSRFNDVDFKNQLSQQYRKIDIKNTLRRNGYRISKESVKDNGTIELCAYAY